MSPRRPLRRMGVFVVTVVAVLVFAPGMHGRTSDQPADAATMPASTRGTDTIEPRSSLDASPPPAQSPASSTPAESVPIRGSGTFRVAAGQSGPVGTGPLLRYTVEVEHGLVLAPEDVATVVETTLADPRGWTTAGSHAFLRTDTQPDVRVLLATPATTDELCAPLRTNGEVSCRNGSTVVLNARRWTLGVDGYAGRLDDYRRYLINHEMGHAIGYGHRACPGPGHPAPVMQQQTYGLDGCLANPWPAP